jgi:hypothetical protein
MRFLRVSSVSFQFRRIDRTVRDSLSTVMTYGSAMPVGMRSSPMSSNPFRSQSQWHSKTVCGVSSSSRFATLAWPCALSEVS